MEAWQVPIIAGAFEFLYGIGNELLQEIKERRLSAEKVVCEVLD